MIWSASEMRRVKYVMESLEVLSQPNYNIMTLIDQTTMDIAALDDLIKVDYQRWKNFRDQ